MAATGDPTAGLLGKEAATAAPGLATVWAKAGRGGTARILWAGLPMGG